MPAALGHRLASQQSVEDGEGNIDKDLEVRARGSGTKSSLDIRNDTYICLCCIPVPSPSSQSTLDVLRIQRHILDRVSSTNDLLVFDASASSRETINSHETLDSVTSLTMTEGGEKLSLEIRHEQNFIVSLQNSNCTV